MSLLRVTTDLELVTCCTCGMLFAFPEQIVDKRRRDHAAFYCPAGGRLHRRAVSHSYARSHRE